MDKEEIIKYLEDEKIKYSELYERDNLSHDAYTSYYNKWLYLKQILEHIK